MTTPVGFCQCGCGQLTPINRRTDAKKGWVAGQPRPYLPYHWPRDGERNPAWKGGRRIGSDGYVYLKMPEHARATTNGYVREHIVIVERAMGKALRRTAEVHHVDEVRSNNHPSNLVVCDSRSYHLLLHRRMRAMRRRAA